MRTSEDAVSMPCRWYGEMVTSARWMRRGRLPRAVPALQLAAEGGIARNAWPGAGTLWQLAVHPALLSLGIGTALVTAAEQRTLRLAP
jgi:GNAT superfamily N-acetyltransferase